MKKLEADDTLFATFHSAFEVLTEIETTVFPSMLSLCIPIGCFMNAAMEAAEAAAKSSSGNSGRVYLPPDWVGHHVKIVRID